MPHGGFVSGVVSGAMLALSMVFVRKTHEQEKVGLFPLMMILSFGGAMALVTPSLLFDAAHLYPQNFKRCDSSLHLRHRYAMLRLGIDCLRHPGFYPYH